MFINKKVDKYIMVYLFYIEWIFYILILISFINKIEKRKSEEGQEYRERKRDGDMMVFIENFKICKIIYQFCIVQRYIYMRYNYYKY